MASAGTTDRVQVGAPTLAVIVSGCLAFAVVVVGGYALGWSWTGFADNGTLWDWLQLFVLPVVLALVPLWYATRRRLRVEWRVLVVVLAITSAIVLFGGYVLGWEWTGFEGKTLWDWLDLLVLPATLVLLPFALESPHVRHPRTRLAVTLLVCGFAALVICGYAFDWAWTGFSGNTLWDWLHLLLVPFVLPLGVTLIIRRTRAEQAVRGA